MTVTMEQASGQAERRLPIQKITTNGQPTPPADPHDSVYGPDTVRIEKPEESQLLAVVAGGALITGAVVAAIGFAGSYGALRDLALSKGFGLFSYAFPIGIDAGIIALQSIDLFLVHKGIKFPLVRWLAMGLTLATIAFNAAAADGPVFQDPVGAAMHGVIPVLYVALAEAGRHYIGRRAALLHGRADLGAPPLSNWLLAPIKTSRAARRMSLWNIPYAEVVQLGLDLEVYEQRLAQDLGPDWKKVATPDQLLPFKMAKSGLSVDKALSLPWEEQLKVLDREGRAALQQAKAEVQKIQADLQIREAHLQAEADQTRAEGRLRLARIETEAEIDNEVQGREAELQKRVAERQAELQRLQDQAEADIAAIKDDTEHRRFLADLERKKQQAKAMVDQKRLELETEQQTRQIDLEAAAHEARMAGLERLAESEELLAAKAQEAEAAKAEKQAAEDRAQAAEALRREAEAERRREEEAAETEALRATKAELAQRAVEAEARAVEVRAKLNEAAARERLTQADWDVLRIMSMLVDAEDETAVTNEVIAGQMGFSTGTASTRRATARMHLDDVDSPLRALFEQTRRAL
ncbi:DUF2637 domain-containing protein [Streptomyces sp. NRRL B-24484]|uniref:DUF2637 domain-containing protein n=1 Tax=Streptomyces sp. NRRL B-24484 TaxID=1463833 RepID=UPI0006942E86|nr:DUF2637 domain-containing protein [Streptomyces sp. NRRL B-24484]